MFARNKQHNPYLIKLKYQSGNFLKGLVNVFGRKKKLSRIFLNLFFYLFNER